MAGRYEQTKQDDLAIDLRARARATNVAPENVELRHMAQLPEYVSLNKVTPPVPPPLSPLTPLGEAAPRVVGGERSCE
jgi:hypothetical protein